MIWLSALGPARVAAALITMLSFGALCAGIAWREARRRRARHRSGAALLSSDAATPPLLIAHASQTGTAERLAWQSARALQLAGVPTLVRSLTDLTRDSLRQVERALFIVSTYGEGDPPDAAAPFVRDTVLATPAGGNLRGLRYGVLALGDSTYARFCGFGQALDQWLLDQGAQALFDRIDVDKGAEPAIERWRSQLEQLSGAGGLPEWSGPAFARWVLSARRHLNPGSAGEAICHLELKPAGGAPLPQWEAGDLLQLRVPGDARPREYSIASLPADGSVHLLVRQTRRHDGSPGAASGWLLATAGVGDGIEARIHEHRGFRIDGNAHRPLILIGNGTGLAGLRALIKARATGRAAADAERGCWLIFGERSSRHDALYAEDIARWRRNGVLTRCDLVYSRDQHERRYVQHRVAECGAALREWVEAGAAIYVCGSLKGMAGGVDAALEGILGRSRLDELTVAGRYRRDVY